MGFSHIRRGRAAITKDNPYPEATMRWLDHLYSEGRNHSGTLRYCKTYLE